MNRTEKRYLRSRNNTSLSNRYIKIFEVLIINALNVHVVLFFFLASSFF